MKKLSLTVQIIVKAETPLNPSEDPEKVTTAVTNVIDDCYVESKYGRIIGRSIGSESLNTIYEQIRSRAALGVLRRVLLDNRTADTTWFLLNKQAAGGGGIIVIVEDKKESPLGPIKVTIKCDELDTVIDWLAPSV
jgi:predicted RNA binding protein with dsRBD fold (UPF0201 family)